MHLGNVRKILHSLYCICSFKQMFTISLHFAFQFSFKTEFCWIPFSNKDLKTLHRQFYWGNWNVFIICLKQIARELSSVKSLFRDTLKSPFYWNWCHFGSWLICPWEISMPNLGVWNLALHPLVTVFVISVVFTIEKL